MAVDVHVRCFDRNLFLTRTVAPVGNLVVILQRSRVQVSLTDRSNAPTPHAVPRAACIHCAHCACCSHLLCAHICCALQLVPRGGALLRLYPPPSRYFCCASAFASASAPTSGASSVMRTRTLAHSLLCYWLAIGTSIVATASLTHLRHTISLLYRSLVATTRPPGRSARCRSNGTRLARSHRSEVT